MQKIIMIIGAGILQLPAIKIAKEMGLYTVVTDYNKNAIGLKYADYPIIMSTRDVDGTVRVAKEFNKVRKIDGVITVGTDASLTVAAVQHALDLPGNRIDVAEATTNKIKMRKRLKEHSIPQPEFYSCWSYDDVQEASNKLGFPFVIKPADNMGARGVMKIEKSEVIRFAYERAKSASPRGEIIAESFMDGPELSIDALVWKGKIYITGVADRIIEFPPYFVETGHIMPTNLPIEQVKNALKVFKNAVRALGIEIGAAKGDIKVTSEGAKVGEIASRLSGGFMSAYTYPYSTGVNLIRAAINIALGLPPGDLTEKFHRVSVERAIIPGSGTVKRIEGVEDALSINGVKNVFVTCNIGDTVHIPTSNVEKCGNVIAVADTREEALHSANLGVKTVRIVLSDEGELNDGLLRKNALLKLSGICSVCRNCDGNECAGWLPGIGSKGDGSAFRRNITVLKNYGILSSSLTKIDNINTGTDLFGIPLDVPVVVAPISNMKRNFQSIFDEREYNKIVLKGAKKAGTIASISQMEYSMDEAVDYIIDPLKEIYGHGIPFFNPAFGETTTLKNIEKCFELGVKLCGLTIDLKSTDMDSLIDDKWLARIIRESPLPLIVKGIINPKDAVKLVDAGVKGVVFSNRGGRILQSYPSGIETMQKIIDKIKTETLVIVDGGFRSGEDIFKGIALGADLVMIGRPIFIAAAGSEIDGVSFRLNRIKEEFREVMRVTGCKILSEISKDKIIKF